MCADFEIVFDSISQREVHEQILQVYVLDISQKKKK